MEPFAVASPHSAATAAGRDVLSEGGSAVDAALAAALVLGTVYPHQCSLGGDAVALVADPGRGPRAVLGFGRSGSALDVAAALHAGGGQVPQRGRFTVTVPGALAAFGQLHSLGGRLPWSRLVAPAQDLAAGAVVSDGLASALHEESAVVLADPGLAAVFAPKGAVLTAGDRLAQPALADTLAQVADAGPRSLYEGRLAERFAAGLERLGVPVWHSDLATCRGEVVRPRHLQWRGTDVWTAPPPSQGEVLLHLLAALGDHPPEELLGPRAGEVVTAAAAACDERDRNLADRPSRPGGDTVAVVAADASGQLVSLIFSVFDAFGSGLLEQSTGLVLQSRGAGFSSDPSSPNALRPAARPAHTLMPVLVGTGGVATAAHGTMGGYAQPQIHAQLLLQRLSGASPAEAVTAPRWVVERGTRHVWADVDLPVSARGALERDGDRVDTLPAGSDAVGHAQIVAAHGDEWLAGSDPRADGATAGDAGRIGP